MQSSYSLLLLLLFILNSLFQSVETKSRETLATHTHTRTHTLKIHQLVSLTDWQGPSRLQVAAGYPYVCRYWQVGKAPTTAVLSNSVLF